MSLRTVLLSIQALLASPEPDDPQDAMVATQYVNNRELFSKTARHWSCVYANGPHKDLLFELDVDKLKQMGFDEVILPFLEIGFNMDRVVLLGVIVIVRI